MAISSIHGGVELPDELVELLMVGFEAETWTARHMDLVTSDLFRMGLTRDPTGPLPLRTNGAASLRLNLPPRPLHETVLRGVLDLLVALLLRPLRLSFFAVKAHLSLRVQWRRPVLLFLISCVGSFRQVSILRSGIFFDRERP